MKRLPNKVRGLYLIALHDGSVRVPEKALEPWVTGNAAEGELFQTLTMYPMIDQTLLEILVCPETKQPLGVADAELLGRVNAFIGEGTLLNRGGSPVTEPLVEALVRQDGSFLYPVRDDIPIMLIDESIPIPPQE